MFFFGGGGNLAERNLGGSEEKPLKIFEIFIPEIAANASNFKNQLTYMGKLIFYHFFSPFLHNYWGGTPGPSPSYGTEVPCRLQAEVFHILRYGYD